MLRTNRDVRRWTSRWASPMPSTIRAARRGLPRARARSPCSSSWRNRKTRPRPRVADGATPMKLSTAFLAASALWLGGMVVTITGQSPAAPTAGDGKIWTGVYSAAQAERGKAPFTGVCRRCHADTLEGSTRGPALKGEKFMVDWEAQDLRRLFDKMRDTMPPDSPASLDDSEYLDVLTYILQANGYPAGANEL